MAEETKSGLGLEKDKDGNVKVNAGALEKLLLEMEDLRGRVNRVEATSDETRLDRYDSKNKKIGPRQYRLTIVKDEKTDKGKLITGWRMLKDKKWIQNGVTQVEQVSEIIYKDLDGKLSKEEVHDYANFANIRHSFRVIGEYQGEEKDGEFGPTILTLKIIGIPDSENAAAPDMEMAQPWIGKVEKINRVFVN